MGVRFIAEDFEVFIFEIKQAFNVRIHLKLWQGARLTGELEADLVEVIMIDMGIAKTMDEISHL